MTRPLSAARSRLPLLLVPALLATAAAPSPAAPRSVMGESAAADSLPTTKLSSDTYAVAAPSGNVVVSVGPAGAIVVGTQAASLTPRLRRAIARLTAAPVRFVIATAGPGAPAAGAAGWGSVSSSAGAIVLMHENLARAMRRATAAGAVVLPAASFSDVEQIYLNGEEVHAVHQPAGYGDADLSVHFERGNVLYLGSLFTNDGYPAIDVADGGSLAGLIDAAGKFLDFPASMRIVPGRGRVATTSDLRAYRDMLVGVRDRVAPLVRAGRPLAAVIAARPTAPWDARWGSGGPVSAADFTAAVYRSLGGH